MQTFILLCFEKEAVLYFVKDGAAKECRYRGNDTLSLDWNKTQFEEMWLYYTDVQDIEDWTDVEILAFCLDKKTTAIWDKLAYPISEQVSSINIQNFSVLLPHLAKAQNLLADGETTLAWREFAWKIIENDCKLLPAKETQAHVMSDDDFVELIVKFLTAQKSSSKNLVASLEAETKQAENIKKELSQVNAKNEKLEQELHKISGEYNKLTNDNSLLAQQYSNLKNTTHEYTQFLASSKLCLLNPVVAEKNSEYKKAVAWYYEAEQKINTLASIFDTFKIEDIYKNTDLRRLYSGFNSFGFNSFGSNSNDSIYIKKRFIENFESLLQGYTILNITDLFLEENIIENDYIQSMVKTIKAYQDEILNLINWFYPMKIVTKIEQRCIELVGNTAYIKMIERWVDELCTVGQHTEYRSWNGDYFYSKRLDVITTHFIVGCELEKDQQNKIINMLTEEAKELDNRKTSIYMLQSLADSSSIDYALEKTTKALKPSIEKIQRGLKKAQKQLIFSKQEDVLLFAFLLADKEITNK